MGLGQHSFLSAGGLHSFVIPEKSGIQSKSPIKASGDDNIKTQNFRTAPYTQRSLAFPKNSDSVFFEDLNTHGTRAHAILPDRNTEGAISMSLALDVQHMPLLMIFDLAHRPGPRQTSQAVQALCRAIDDLLADIEFFLFQSCSVFVKPLSGSCYATPA